MPHINLYKTKYKPGDEVYFLKWECNCPAAMAQPRYGKTKIRSLQCELFQESDKKSMSAMFRGYTIDEIRSIRRGDSCLPSELYSTEEEAKEKTAWIEVPKMIDQTWMNILGDRGLDDLKFLKKEKAFEKLIEKEKRPWIRQMGKVNKVDLEVAQLGICCAGISDTRDILWDAYRHRGLIQQKVERICYLLKGSGHADMYEHLDGDANFKDLNRLFHAIGVYTTAKKLKLTKED